MKQGTLCTIKSKRQSVNSFLILYPDLEELLRLRNVENGWAPPMLSDPSELSQLTSLKQCPVAINTTDPVVFLEEKQDENGKMYFHCLCRDYQGWAVASSRHYDLVENTDNHAANQSVNKVD